MWLHNYVIGHNEFLISTLLESTIPWVYSLQFLFKSTNNSWRYERKCEWVFFFWTQCICICVFCAFFVLSGLFSFVALFLQYVDIVGWVFWRVKTVSHNNLYCVGGDVKPCTIQSNCEMTALPLRLSCHMICRRRCVQLLSWSLPAASSCTAQRSGADSSSQSAGGECCAGRSGGQWEAAARSCANECARRPTGQWRRWRWWNEESWLVGLGVHVDPFPSVAVHSVLLLVIRPFRCDCEPHRHRLPVSVSRCHSLPVTIQHQTGTFFLLHSHISTKNQI